jgi:hypothetical protein
MSIFHTLSPIAIRLTGSPLNSALLADALIHDGGHDIEPLLKKDLIALTEGNFEGNWKNVIFTCSELLAFYSATELEAYQVLGWCFATLILGEATSRGETDWRSHNYVLTQGFSRVGNVLNYEEFRSILKTALDFPR